MANSRWRTLLIVIVLVPVSFWALSEGGPGPLFLLAVFGIAGGLVDYPLYAAVAAAVSGMAMLEYSCHAGSCEGWKGLALFGAALWAMLAAGVTMLGAMIGRRRRLLRLAASRADGTATAIPKGPTIQEFGNSSDAASVGTKPGTRTSGKVMWGVVGILCGFVSMNAAVWSAMLIPFAPALLGFVVCFLLVVMGKNWAPLVFGFCGIQLFFLFFGMLGGLGEWGGLYAFFVGMHLIGAVIGTAAGAVVARSTKDQPHQVI